MLDVRSCLCHFSKYVSESLVLVFRCVWLMNVNFSNVGSSPDYYMLQLVLLWLLRKWLGAEVLIAVSSG